MIKCNFCKQEFSSTVLDLHENDCIKNPKNIIEEPKKDTDNENDLTKNKENETEEPKKDAKKVK